jgi:16S rRNA A1518/A1519 N6-dimethyltransferase RsmA/KsgA/DIM1 with predicted DNA glycosylase/AP lyase activity
VRQTVQRAFAHRRKALPRSYGLAGGDREGAVAALTELGLAPNVRAEALAPEQLRALAEALR